ncbi:MAG: type II toxin-antitoxin system VapC family toxin [Solirubrobacteraceae bacterium]
MILADTSIWVDHLRRGEVRLAELLRAQAVLGHPWVTGEISLGALRSRAEVLGLLGRLPQAQIATDTEMLALIDGRELHGRGIGWVDVQLLAAALLTPRARLWTRDRPLARAAAQLGVAAD